MRIKIKKAMQLIAIIVLGIFMVATVVTFAHNSAEQALAMGPISPPEGYAKLSLSTKVVTPTLAKPGSPVGPELAYTVEILNTGAYTAEATTLVDQIPVHTAYKLNSVKSSVGTAQYASGRITWSGKVGFDSSVIINFNVIVNPGYQGIVTNTAVIDDPAIAEPVSATAESMITNNPVFTISKTATPALPGKNKPLTYELVVTNVGQPADNYPINVTDAIPGNTTFQKASPGGTYSQADKLISWNPDVSMATGVTQTFTFTVKVNNVPSGTVLNNVNYFVNGNIGEPYTTTVVDPILILSKSIEPDPPGSNSGITYTLTLLNLGSKATGLVITDKVPAGITYAGGGDSYSGGIVTWNKLPDLDTGESLQVTFNGTIGDIANVVVLNNDYHVHCAEGVEADGIPVPSLIVGPIFDVTASVYPIAHKPGQGAKTGEPVTPTFTIENLGPGNAIDATALLTFERISVSNIDVLKAMDSEGNPVGELYEGPACILPNCWNYGWVGDLNVGDKITITVPGGRNTIGGGEWTPYTATVVVTDDLSGYVMPPIEKSAIGHVTHMSNLIPEKSAPLQIGPGQNMTYTIEVINSGLSTTEPPAPVLTETLPTSVTLVAGSISDGGTSKVVGGRTVISWNLPAMSPGDNLTRTFEVKVSPTLISGTLLVNQDYATTTYEPYLNGFKHIAGEPFTTTIHEVGLIDSFKEVTPTWTLPGPGNVLTWTVHVNNTGPNNLTNVVVDDIFPWQHSTYLRDAEASSGTVISDIVSLQWTGNVPAFSEQLITFTTRVDDFFEGVLTNTAIIVDDSLKQPLEITAVAYITNKPVLQISKTASPNPVLAGATLLYKVDVTNLGQQATLLTITDTVPANTTYVPNSASSGGQLVGNTVQWIFPVLKHGDTLHLTFQVVVNGGLEVVNDHYAVICKEGVSAFGEPVVTKVFYLQRHIFMPLLLKQ